MPRFGGYNANGGWWLLESVWWSAAYKIGDGRIGDVRSPAQCAMIKENTEDFFNESLNAYLRGGSLYAGGAPWFNYYWNNGQNSGGRHMRRMGVTGEPWGDDNIIFYDGHVERVSMRDIVENIPIDVWSHQLSYPFSAARARTTLWPPSDDDPPVGAEFWTVPWW